MNKEKPNSNNKMLNPNPFYNPKGNYSTMSSYSNNFFSQNAQKNNSSIKLELKPFSPNVPNQTSSINGYPPNMSPVVNKKE